MGTHSAFGEGSHTTAHTPKQEPSLSRPQCGFVLSVKFLLFHHAFIYIHFPVLCEPSTPADEKKSAKLPSQFYLRPPLVAFFSLSHKRPTFAFMGKNGYTLGFWRRIAHKGLHAETRGVLDGGAVTTLGLFHTFRKPCVAGCQNGKLCRFQALVGGHSRKTQRACGTAMHSCASLFRGVAAPLGCVIFFTSVEIAASTPCAQDLSACAR